MNVRPATQDDRETLRRFWTALYEEAPEPDHRRKRWSAVEDDVRTAIDEHVALIAEEECTPTGFVLAHARHEHIGYVTDLYVSPDNRRRGIAHALLEEARRRLGCPVLELDVAAENADARAFYERLGFREQSVRLAIESERLR